MATIDPEQSAEKLINMTAHVEGGYKARTVRANAGKVPIATCPATTARTRKRKTRSPGVSQPFGTSQSECLPRNLKRW